MGVASQQRARCSESKNQRITEPVYSKGNVGMLQRAWERRGRGQEVAGDCPQHPAGCLLLLPRPLCLEPFEEELP